MSRRKSAADQEFGSDSFLDIIANIVGILIILIVVAGVKVARQAEIRDPVSANMTQDMEVIPGPVADDPLPARAATPTNLPLLPTETEADSDAVSWTEEQLAASRVQLEALKNKEREYQKQVEDLTLQMQQTKDSLATSGEQLAALQQNLNATEAKDRQAEVQFASVQREIQAAESTLQTLKTELASEAERADLYRGTLDSLDQRQSYVHDALQQVSMETRRLKEVLLKNQAEGPELDLLKHRLSPVSRAVAEQEIHFRLSGGRIAHVPLETLLERLKEQMISRRSLVAKFHRYNGSVGPVQGFRMEYIVQRQSLPPLQALQYGQAPYQLSVSRWQIHPTETLEAESVDDALRIGSRFRQILERTYPETAITIWLYPADFKHFHRLRQFAHQLDLRVAARPLPEGFPITASPSGSRSTSQ